MAKTEIYGVFQSIFSHLNAIDRDQFSLPDAYLQLLKFVVGLALWPQKVIGYIRHFDFDRRSGTR